MNAETRHASEFTFRMNPQESEIAKKYPQFVSALRAYVDGTSPVKNNAEYAEFLQGVVNVALKYKEELAQATPIFDQEIQPIGSNELTIKTGWGGVSFKEVSIRDNSIEKLLVAEQASTPSGVLGFEYHHLKDEKLEVLEGVVIYMLSDHSASNWVEGQVLLTLAGVGDTAVIHPESEHGVIPLTNTVIMERSDNHVDRSDLLFIFQVS